MPARKNGYKLVHWTMPAIADVKALAEAGMSDAAIAIAIRHYRGLEPTKYAVRSVRINKLGISHRSYGNGALNFGRAEPGGNQDIPARNQSSI